MSDVMQNDVLLNKKVSLERCLHQYTEIDLDIMKEVIEHRAQELLQFANTAVSVAG